MRRCFLALAVLLIGSVSVSQANYVIIRVVLKQQVKAPTDPNNPNNPNNNQGYPMGMVGNVGMAGGTSPMPRPGGFSGVMGIMGMGGQYGNKGGQFGNKGGGKEKAPPSLQMRVGDYVTAVVPLVPNGTNPGGFHVIDRSSRGLPNDLLIWSKWGRTMMFKDGVEILYQPYNRTNPFNMYVARNQAMRGNKRGPDDLQRFALWCLSVGLNDKAMSVMDELTRVVENTKGDMPAQITQAVAAYNQVKGQLGRGTNKQDMAREWSERMDYRTVATSEHYALLYNDSSLKESVQRRLKFLEETFRAFYLYHAIKGKVLPFPEQKQVAVVVSGPDFEKYRQVFDADESVDDGFHARRDNIAFFVGQRVDEASRNFDQLVKNVYREFSAEGLLKGEFFNRDLRDIKGVHTVARAQTLALVDAVLQEEAEFASASHEGARQLCYATGLLKTNVTIPEWLRFGLASQFEFPKGPFPGNIGTVKSAFWPGVGGPSWPWMTYFNELKKSKRLHPLPYMTLVSTVTDEDFRLAREGLESKRKLGEIAPTLGEMFTQKRQDALDRARTLSWALAYYLQTQRYEELQKYYQGLASLPRDLELDENAALMVFARAFNLVDVGLDQDTVDVKKFNGFAKEWLDWMDTQRSPIEEFQLEKIDPIDPNDPNGGLSPGGPYPGPGGPGGGPGGPGNVPVPPGGRPGPKG